MRRMTKTLRGWGGSVSSTLARRRNWLRAHNWADRSCPLSIVSHSISDSKATTFCRRARSIIKLRAMVKR